MSKSIMHPGGQPEGEMSDRDLEAVCAGKQESNLPEFSPRNRLRTRILDEISIRLTSI